MDGGDGASIEGGEGAFFTGLRTGLRDDMHSFIGPGYSSVSLFCLIWVEVENTR
jgi:hypothetical protein